MSISSFSAIPSHDALPCVPRIGVIADQGEHSGVAAQAVMQKYLDAIVLAGGIPFILPHALATHSTLFAAAMRTLDGLFLTGSHSNVEPVHYPTDDQRPETCLDQGRDALAFQLIDHALRTDMPLLGICRGFQELVVRTGGSLYRHVHELDAFHDHREDERLPLEGQYAPVHDVELTSQGLLAQLLPDTPVIHVNSLHGQGARTLGEDVTVEAIADDGLVEAISVPRHRFILGVQWHPEWQSRAIPASRLLFDAFLHHACDYNAER
ncbi:gamma-glutamyl-gamma-aminobutyrate hydrolase family protein [Zymobacter palmae]|uniref:gamma-glutamyl-gamma-aminobutyrate hydrolase n=1 Tax=Zymobacter palmae TaxID=33074 RepID=A0A348HC41_9GAMM|nr:gamma-glutamyl-gamma-aminobutyrate hydrolase family protein [Zymobacter palmae]BBG29193.1 predicted glutamine amidotransferases [Zymobacter palmae]